MGKHTATEKLSKVLPIAKAVAAGVTAGATALAVGVQDGQLDVGEIVTAALAILSGLGITYEVPNKDA